jgi:hypothetical protein
MWRVWRGKYLFFIRPQAKYEDFLLRWTCIRPNSSFLCEQVILNSVSISPHMERCAAIAEVESGERVEKSLFEPPEGMTRDNPCNNNMYILDNININRPCV